MSKMLGAMGLVAGTAIGAGMLALPLTISSLGIMWGSLSMILIWFAMYSSALFGLELNLQAKQGMTLGKLGEFYSGIGAKSLGTFCLILLMYSLMSAYLFGGTSVLLSFLGDAETKSLFWPVLGGITGGISLVLLGPTSWIDHSNRFLFILMIVLFICLIAGLGSSFQNEGGDFIWPETMTNLHSWQIAIPVIYTSYGFHVIFHSLVDYCDQDPVILKRSFFWGSFIPLIIYLSWTIISLGVVYAKAPDTYHQLMHQHIDLGQFVKTLRDVTGSHWLQQIVWSVTFLAIITSALGVGLALMDAWREYLPFNYGKTTTSLILTISLPFLVAAFIPQAFIKALSFAGMILTIIAIFLPIYLFYKARKKRGKTVVYSEVNSLFLQGITLLIGVIVFGCEILNLSGISFESF